MLVEVNVDKWGISRKQECWKNLGDDKKPFIIKLKWVVGSEDYDNFDSFKRLHTSILRHQNCRNESKFSSAYFPTGTITIVIIIIIIISSSSSSSSSSSFSSSSSIVVVCHVALAITL